MPRRKKRTITAEDLYRFRLMTGCEISPGGQHIVFDLQRVDRKTEKKYTNLFVVPTRGGRARQFTYGDHVDSQPQFSPDGKSIAFVSNRKDEKQAQIYVIPFEGGEARQVTDLKGSFGTFRWSPDGKHIAFVFRKKDEEEIEREKDEAKKKLGVVARHIERVFFKLDGAGFLPKERWHIWTVSAAGGRTRQITDHQVYDERDPAWSPDGKHIAFISNRTAEPDLDPDAEDLFVIPSRGGSARLIKTRPGSKANPSYSPDGKYIAYHGVDGKSAWWRNLSIFVVPANGKGRARNITGKFDVHTAAWTINDLPGHLPVMPPAWSQDGGRIFFQVDLRGDTLLCSLDREGKDRDLTIEIGDRGVVGAFTFDKAQKKLAYFHGEMTEIGDIWVMDTASRDTKRLTRVNERALRDIDLGSVEEVWFKGAARNDLQGWIMKPPGFNPRKKYPSILEIHGGPRVQYGNYFMHEFYFLAAQGYVVFFSNPRGGRGYGEKHAKSIVNNWGSVDYDDLMAWASYVARKPYIDTKRMGVTGGSYGGYMTNWIIGHTARFKAAVTQRSVSNLVSMWGSSDFNWAFQEEFGNQPPWENLQNYWRQSPMKYMGKVKTPTLVIHSEQDLRCAIEQGEQVFVALKKIGVDTEMVRFPDEPHGLSRGGRTDRRIERLKHIIRWFDKYLK
jgi:dipeptidyl aminopeptidase/acylaminoacyl peptidase